MQSARVRANERCKLEFGRVLQDLGPLNGLPGSAKFINVVGKAPTERDWNAHPDKWLTAGAVAERNLHQGKYTGTGLMTDPEQGGCAGSTSTVRKWRHRGAEIGHAGFPAPVLPRRRRVPPCSVNISGRPGRFRALMRMPEQWTEFFHGFSIAGREMPTSGLEFLYEKAGGKLFHAVVDGTHPDGQGWHYRWEDGKSLADIPIPDLPMDDRRAGAPHGRKAAARQEREERSEQRERGESPSTSCRWGASTSCWS